MDEPGNISTDEPDHDADADAADDDDGGDDDGDDDDDDDDV